MKNYFMNRKASDNKYLHRDFFISGDIGLKYVGENYGDAGVEEYLTMHAKSFYKTLAEEYALSGLSAIRAYFEKVYKNEEWLDNLHVEETEKRLKITIDKCPAITYMKSVGHKISKWYKQTTYITYEVLAKMCGLDFFVEYYNEEDGSTSFFFLKKEKESQI